MPTQPSTEPNTPTEAKAYLWLGAIALATFFLYLAVGIYYVTHNAERLGGPNSLQLKDEAFLASYATWDTDEEGDVAFYNRLALGVIHTGYPRNRTGSVSIYAPVYTYFLAACYSVGGLRLWSIVVPQAVLAALLAWVSGLAAARLAPAFKPGVMWLAAGLIMVNLRFAATTAVVIPTLAVLLVFSIALYFAAGPLNRRSLLGLAGMVVLGIYTQSAFFVVAFGIALWLGWLFLKQRQLAVGVCCVLVFLGFGSMVTLRLAVAKRGDSYKRENKIMLWESNNPYYESMAPLSLWGRRPGNPWSQWRPSAEDERRYDAYFQRGKLSRTDPGLLWILENPAAYAKLCWIRLYTTLGPFTGQMSPRNRVISSFFWLLIFPAGYYGLWRTRASCFSKMAALIFLVLTAFESLVIAEWYSRYRMPWELILTLYAAVGYMSLLAGISHRSAGASPRTRQNPQREGDLESLGAAGPCLSAPQGVAGKARSSNVPHAQ